MYLEKSWKGMPPSEEDIQAMWNRINFSIVPTKLDQHALFKAYREVYLFEENVVFFQVKASNDPIFSWYASRNRLPEIGFFRKLLRSQAIVSHPYLELDSLSVTEPVFEFTSGFCLGGLLATDLFWGGTIRGFTDTSIAAKNLGETFFETLAGNRFEEVTVYRTCEAWSSWFQEYGADRTYIILDRRTEIFSLFLLTGSA